MQATLAAFAKLDGLSLLGEDPAIGKFHLSDGQGGEIHFMKTNERWYITSVG
jgi:hypothetical protein